MIRTYAIATLYLLALSASASGQTLTIDSCYEMARRNYPLIRQYGLIEKTSEYTLSNANKAYLPQISLTAIEGYIFGELPTLGPGGESANGDFKFIGIAQLNQTIWDGGATKAQKQIIKAASGVETASVDVALHDLRSRVNQLYFGVLMVDEQMSQLEVQNTILTNNANRIKQLTENGLAYITDLHEIKVELLKLNQKRTEFRYTREGYLTMLSLLVGVKISDQNKLMKPEGESAPNASLARPELSWYQRQRDLVAAQSAIQRVARMPKVGLIGAGVMLAPGIGRDESGTSSLGVAGLSASWNIGGLYRNRNEKRLTEQSLSKVALQEETFRFNTNLQLSQTSASIEKQKAILAEDDEIVSLRKLIRESYQVKYDAGESSLLDLLNATEKESEARAQKALHEMQLLMTIYEFKTTTGN